MKKLLPPILFLIFVISMSLICWWLDSPHQMLYPYNLAGLVVIGVGLLLAMSGKRLFKKRNTNIMTFDEPTLLVTEGVYKYTRNPMYLGFVVSLLGFAILTGAANSSFLLTAIFVLVTDRWYIKFEEQMMRDKFGQDYEDYCRKVRRWF
ncbi:methyltransferase family protein [Vibrio lentus]|uniref:Steroid 5-alpha reductase C-terminal domain-containing protein n=1 Tax=Vibrio lentus TaxID=136468 RepID=A0AA44VUX3_9VIBR|nr:isoprenylcysteine carboxylmethyltransferase family protein [Vibrio lentus]MCB5358795.1 isoprenylcysteine carboxylmethyltransferase family protein [Vibrio lentus]MCB5449253.1 isoprenylcysteine carboxylmethyltransferase family protein [Vibrio lentus]MCB5461146.1 isoprenylcysteine carboxylmethyltransferase family protein [Vibrio lentus]MCC4794494.1 isoprenylcysteine carboxylmethyltransferase family protein [Vibrio lentus]MCC4852689.1 isoprenylcysteine carboxylmethyltransferase family protein [